MIKISTQSFIKSLVLGSSFLFASYSANAQTPASLNSIGTPWIQNFDNLANSGTGHTLSIIGLVMSETGSSANAFYQAGAGTLATGDVWSFGNTSATERALGTIRSNNLIPTIGATLINQTGVTITQLHIEYEGEFWRCGATGRRDSLMFQYSLDATDLTTGTWTDVVALNFKTPHTAGPTGAIDGNQPVNGTIISSTITGISIPNGSQFFIRWVDADITGSEDGLAIEDLWVTPQLAPVLPTLSVTDVTMNEGNSGTTTFDFTVDLSAPAGAGGVTFDIQTADGTALISDADYVTNSLTGQTIPAGSSSYTFSVLVNGDVTPEANDTFYVNVTNVTGATVTDAQGMGIITDDDTTPPLVTGEPSDETVCAGDLAIFSAQATGAPTPTVQWQVSTDGGANWSDVSGATATTYSFNPASSQDGNMYWAIFTNGGGVDTTAAVTLTVNPTYSISETFAVCSGSNYTFPDGSTTTNITSTVVHLSSFTTSLGCDSNIVTTINVNPLYNLNQNANVCSGSNFQFPDGTMANNVTSTVSHTSNLTSVITGCDSIINTTVNVTPIDTTSLAQSICSGTVYDFFGTNLSAAGIYYHTLTNMAGCDSIIELDLSLDMVPVAGFTSSIDVDTVDFTNTSTGAFSYLWDLSDGNGFSFTGMNATHIYPANASYTVCLIATSIQGCADTVCDVIQIQNISLKDQYVKASFEVYPNPAKEQVTIAFGTEVKAATVKVINALGKTILTKDIRNAADAKINLNTIDGGVYFIQVDINGERMLKRLIVE